MLRGVKLLKLCISRAISIWRPRARYQSQPTPDGESLSAVPSDEPGQSVSATTADDEELPAPLRMIFPSPADIESDPSVLVDVRITPSLCSM